METWLPRFACPECAGNLDEDPAGAIVCLDCGQRFEGRDHFYRFLTPTRMAAAEPFLRQYRLVRERDGYRRSTPEYYRMLPSVLRGDPHRSEWQLRRESYRRFQRHALQLKGPIRILDVGAGNGWLSHRLASSGHHVVAIDRLDDETDGLGACCHYATRFPCVQADFDALPFAPCEFDVVVFNGSLHYSPDVPATLAAARRLLNGRNARDHGLADVPRRDRRPVDGHREDPSVPNGVRPEGSRSSERRLSDVCIAVRCREHGVVPEYSFVIGVPPDPLADLERTFEFIRSIKRVNSATEIVLYTYTPVPTDGALYSEAGRQGFVFPTSLDEWASDRWRQLMMRRGDGIPWIDGTVRRRIYNFERVLNAYYPTVTDRRLTRSRRALLRAVSAWRYRWRMYAAPYELRALHRVIRYQRPETTGL